VEIVVRLLEWGADPSLKDWVRLFEGYSRAMTAYILLHFSLTATAHSFTSSARNSHRSLQDTGRKSQLNEIRIRVHQATLLRCAWPKKTMIVCGHYKEANNTVILSFHIFPQQVQMYYHHQGGQQAHVCFILVLTFDIVIRTVPRSRVHASARSKYSDARCPAT
jgi:hypothetical protein